MKELLLNRLARFITPIDSGCWEWIGCLNHGGYGHISTYGEYGASVHRIMYRMLVGEIGPEYEVHHKCENRKCCNPEHLRALLHSEHEAAHPNKQYAALLKTHCPEGHPYDQENTYREKRTNRRGGRQCRACLRIKAYKFMIKTKPWLPRRKLDNMGFVIPGTIETL